VVSVDTSAREPSTVYRDSVFTCFSQSLQEDSGMLLVSGLNNFLTNLYLGLVQSVALVYQRKD
jgi:hypothetical protein